MKEEIEPGIHGNTIQDYAFRFKHKNYDAAFKDALIKVCDPVELQIFKMTYYSRKRGWNGCIGIEIRMTVARERDFKVLGSELKWKYEELDIDPSYYEEEALESPGFFQPFLAVYSKSDFHRHGSPSKLYFSLNNNSAWHYEIGRLKEYKKATRDKTMTTEGFDTDLQIIRDKLQERQFAAQARMNRAPKKTLWSELWSLIM